MKVFNKKNVLIFVGGAISSVLCKKMCMSKCARTLAVKSVAQGLKFKDDVNYTLASIKEEAEDIYEEAKAEAADCCECGCGCESEVEE